MWTVPDDFDSRVIPIDPPANTYNLKIDENKLCIYIKY
jgi:hypothetical protein